MGRASRRSARPTPRSSAAAGHPLWNSTPGSSDRCFRPGVRHKHFGHGRTSDYRALTRSIRVLSRAARNDRLPTPRTLHGIPGDRRKNILAVARSSAGRMGIALSMPQFCQAFADSAGGDTYGLVDFLLLSSASAAAAPPPATAPTMIAVFAPVERPVWVAAGAGADGVGVEAGAPACGNDV